MSPSTRDPKYAVLRSIAMPSGWNPSGSSIRVGNAAGELVVVGVALAADVLTRPSSATDALASVTSRRTRCDMGGSSLIRVLIHLCYPGERSGPVDSSKRPRGETGMF